MTSVSSLPATGDGSARRDHRLVGVAHLLVGGGLLAWALVWLVCVHMAAAAWHGWVLHDTTLKRIWFGR